MKVTTFLCDHCKKAVHESRAMIVEVSEGRIIISKFKPRLADVLPCVCGDQCLHPYLASHIGEFHGKKPNLAGQQGGEGADQAEKV